MRRALPLLSSRGLEACLLALAAPSFHLEYVTATASLRLRFDDGRLTLEGAATEAGQVEGLFFTPPLAPPLTTLIQGHLDDLHQLIALSMDPLTGLCQRNLFLHFIEREAAAWAGASVAFLDIDGFRVLTDEHPMCALSPLLLHLRDQAEAAIPEALLICRWGRDKLALVTRGALSDVTRALTGAATRYPEGLPEGLRRTFSFSVAELRLPLDALIDQLEAALRAAKRGKRWA
ncbi:GGDEF domain-containing protein [Myxococcota bacterium]|nr:GGDEF domain-containing protein [Myxococcota bacterium]MBU1897656.1 GGDEF domain-containing protein [Myxococcota bacterium]